MAKTETMSANSRTTKTITFSLPPEMVDKVKQVMPKEDGTMKSCCGKPSASKWVNGSGWGPSDKRV